MLDPLTRLTGLALGRVSKQDGRQICRNLVDIFYVDIVTLIGERSVSRSVSLHVLADKISRDCTPSFLIALDRYIASVPEKSRKKSFVDVCHKAGQISPEALNASLRDIKQQSAQQSASKTVSEVLEPMVRGLKDYNGIVNTLGNQPLTSVAHNQLSHHSSSIG